MSYNAKDPVYVNDHLTKLIAQIIIPSEENAKKYEKILQA